jgi:hypothetical protein
MIAAKERHILMRAAVDCTLGTELWTINVQTSLSLIAFHILPKKILNSTPVITLERAIGGFS